ncbi:MAG: protoporphyrinogen/coproporphyrinogen oxidase [Acidimicrobiaceae bacterium]|jgi:oxygen-dependent protoporphyrinogen oxidase
MTRRIAVVGGGITGLATAYELCAHAPDAEIVVFESSERLGGKVATTTFAGRAIDEGADAFLARVPWGLDLCRELGIDTQLVSPAQQSAYVWFEGALRRLPAGLVLGVPTDLDAVAASGIVTEPIVVRPAPAPLAGDADIAVGELVRAQLGDAVFERLVNPLVGGINAGDGDRLSLRAAAPQLAAAAERDRDLVAALRAQPPPAAGPVFYAPVGGMGAIVDALTDAITAAGVEVRCSSPVDDLDSLDADLIVVTTPAHRAADLVRAAAANAAALLDGIAYSSVALVTLAYPNSSITRSLDASGFLVPRTEGLLMTASSWSSSKWAHLAGDSTIVRVSTGRFGDDRSAQLDDDTLVRTLVDEVATTTQIDAEPIDVMVRRWPQSFPQYEPGHLDRVAEIERTLADALPNVVLAGAALRGIGVPACIRQGREAARAVVTR